MAYLAIVRNNKTGKVVDVTEVYEGTSYFQMTVSEMLSRLKDSQTLEIKTGSHKNLTTLWRAAEMEASAETEKAATGVYPVCFANESWDVV